MPDLPQDTREHLLLHQFLSGLPTAISKQLHSTGENQRLELMVEQTRLLMAIESDQESKSVAMISENNAAKECSEVMQLKTQLSELTEQVTTLALVQPLTCHS